MKRISYADSKIATHDRVADLVLEYAKVLARTDSADTVTIPYLTDSGEIAEITMLIGPSSQVTASTDDDDEFTADPAPAIAELERRIQLRTTPRNVPTQVHLPEDEFDDDDLDGFEGAER